ncbi:DNA-protecting protein DprA [Apilactobacillus kunkeei]|uniref:DNA-processing protein DprA n=1 Tax=Apilactobacillus kunkeei TaxID=148814 RepID=UPI00110CCA4F|nr:DNA-processing protein DprA [Apilactobacillus kunkeei]TMS99179.1 DNA-protecting protein DprA [Apilactobacillus kunkeei]
MKTRELLLKLKLAKSIGIKSEYRFYQWLKSTYDVIPDELNMTAEEIAETLMLSKNKSKTFINFYNSDKLNSELDHHINHVKWLTIIDDLYPENLKEAYLPPIVLFYFGDLRLLENKALAIVGSRNNTEYSVEVIRRLMPDVINNGITIVSGLAKGVDRLAHLAAIANHGKTIAVIGTGLDQYYPRENESLQRTIAKNHLLLSEYPVGCRPARYHFPERNRIIAGLVRSILVTEAKYRSGSLITANLALQNNRNVLAVPGRIDSELSVGCNDLIQAGAKPVITAKDILEEYKY